ncbi:MAG: acetolactate decarboxylase [Gammaproteobacteria bacterium]
MTKPILFQVGTIASLLQGVHIGEVDIATLKQYGDFGIGTFHAVDGELIVIDGDFYRIAGHGEVTKVELTKKTPFALVTSFQVEQTFTLTDIADVTKLEDSISQQFASKNYIYAVRIDGEFFNMQVRSLKAQPQPFRPLAEVLPEIQMIFDLGTTQGTIVDFYFPEYMSDINLTGHHMHYLNAEKTAGGHVFAAGVKQATVSVCRMQEFILHFPMNKDFAAADLAVKKAELEEAEKAK